MYKYQLKREQPVTHSASGYSYINILQQNASKNKRKPTIEWERGKGDVGTANKNNSGKKKISGKAHYSVFIEKQLNSLFINSQNIP